MIRYANHSGQSAIITYESGDDYLKVQFNTGQTYTYTYNSAGSGTVEEMKRLAIAGAGLNSYIMRYAKKSYESKF
jgi:hypothetical protein